MLVALTSVQSCGVTTATLALTAAWPATRPLPIAVELDPAGGELVSRFKLALEPSTLTLAADIQRSPSLLDAAALRAHSQELPGGSQAVPSPIDGAETGAALDVLAQHLPALRGAADIVADCGRIDPHPRESITRLLAAADAVVLVTVPTLPQLLRLQARLPGLRALCSPAVILCGDGPFPAVEVAETLDVPVLGHLPRDDAAAAMFRGEPTLWRRPRRLPLLRAALPLASALCTVSEAARVDASSLSFAEAPG